MFNPKAPEQPTVALKRLRNTDLGRKSRNFASGGRLSSPFLRRCQAKGVKVARREHWNSAILASAMGPHVQQAQHSAPARGIRDKELIQRKTRIAKRQCNWAAPTTARAQGLVRTNDQPEAECPQADFNSANHKFNTSHWQRMGKIQFPTRQFQPPILFDAFRAFTLPKRAVRLLRSGNPHPSQLRSIETADRL
jgi:hypothetical protein